MHRDHNAARGIGEVEEGREEEGRSGEEGRGEREGKDPQRLVHTPIFQILKIPWSLGGQSPRGQLLCLGGRGMDTGADAIY